LFLLLASCLLPSTATQQQAGEAKDGFFAKRVLAKGFWILLDCLQTILGKGFCDSGFFTLQFFIFFCRFKSYDGEHFKLIVIYISLSINNINCKMIIS
jgi:hypothetical protein